MQDSITVKSKLTTIYLTCVHLCCLMLVVSVWALCHGYEVRYPNNSSVNQQVTYLFDDAEDHNQSSVKIAPKVRHNK